MKPLLRATLLAATTLALLAPVAEADYWISSTGKTHNSRCRYYKNGKGRVSQQPSAVNCKICKGAGR